MGNANSTSSSDDSCGPQLLPYFAQWLLLIIFIIIIVACIFRASRGDKWLSWY